jgi:hypothetical protein
LANTNAYIATKITNAVSTTIQTRNIIPESDITYNLGSPTRRFKTLYISGNTIALGTANLSSTGSTLKVGGQTLATNGYLTSTYIANTTARTLISDRYQVANVNTNFFKKTGVIAQTVTPLTTFSANVSIEGKLFVTGGVQTYTANNLVLGDNMIYLNSGNITDNPDLGFAGNYNDGTYHHTGFFRDASDAGTWKVFENYAPEPDANVYINTAHATFRLAPFSAQNITVARNLTVVANTVAGNTSVTGFLKLNGTDVRTTFAQNTYVKSTLANTNAYIATKVNTTTFNSALANTNSYIATKVSTTAFNSIWANTNSRITLVNSNLTGTNTALRTLISDRLQVANASAIYQTKAVERAALANTNAYIGTKVNTTTFNSALANTNTYIATKASWAALTSTNTAIRALDAQKLSVANAVATYTTKSNPTTSGLLAHTGRATISTNLAVSGNATVSGTMTATGTVSGLELTSTLASGDEGGQINLAKPPNATTLGGVTIDAYQNKLRIFEQGGTARGVYIDLTSAAAGVGTNLLTGGTSTSQYLQVANAVATYATKAYAAANSYVKSVLANTNSYIATKVNTTTFNSALANTNNYIATRATWSALTSTNTALRTLISDRLQVSNAVATYQTKTVERAALANTNAYIRSQLANTNAYIATKASWSGLTSTNTALRILINDRLQVTNAIATYQTKAVERAALANTNAYIRSQLANTNAYIATRASWAGLTSTNTALRTLISDRLQIANAVATYQTKTVERAALANTNAYIATRASWTALTTTNTAIQTLVSDRLQVANAVAIYTTKSNPTTSGVLAHTGRATISTNLTVSGNTVVTKLVANGSLGTAGYILKTNGTNVYWDVAPTGGGSGGGIVSLTTKTLDSLKGSDTVVTAGQTTAATNYLQVANAVSTYATKVNPTFSGTIDAAGADIKNQTLTDGVTISWNAASGQIATVTLGGNRTMAAPTNLKVGTYILHVYQDATGSRTITWNSVFKWVGGVTPTLTTTANAHDVMSFISDGTNLYGSYLPDVK